MVVLYHERQVAQLCGEPPAPLPYLHPQRFLLAAFDSLHRLVASALLDAQASTA
jgi:hypothetical protein